MHNTVNILLIKEYKLFVNFLDLVRHEICCIAFNVSILWASFSWDIKLYTHRKCMSGKTHLQFLDHGSKRIKGRRYDGRQIVFSWRGCIGETNSFCNGNSSNRTSAYKHGIAQRYFQIHSRLIAEPRGNQPWTYGNCRRHQLRFSRQNRRQRMC